MADIKTIAALEQIYNTPPSLASTAKEVGWLTPDYRKHVEASPFAVLATVGPEGLDCSPRGDQPGFVRIADDKTLIMPDRRGNNRIDSLRNIVRDPRIALLFLNPGSGTTFRVNGTAVISAGLDLLESFAVAGKAPRTAIIITITSCYFQCARAIVRSNLWSAGSHGTADNLPTPGKVLEDLTKGEINANAYDAEWPIRAAKTLW